VDTVADDGPALAGQRGHLGHGEGAVAVRLGQVLGHLALESEVLHQADVHGRGPALSALNLQVRGNSLGALRLQVAGY